MLNRLYTIFLFAIFSCSFIISQQAVSFTVSPTPNSIGVSTNTEIRIIFNSDIDAQTISGKNLIINGSNSGLIKGNVVYFKENNSIAFIPANKLFAGEVISVEIYNIRNKQGSLLKGFQWRFDVGISKKTNANFSEIANCGVQAHHPIAFDIDKDGAVDLVSSTGKVFYNDGTGRFIKSKTVTELNDLSFIADLNNDGNVDAICSLQESNNDARIYLSDSAGDYHLSQILYPLNNKWGIIKEAGDINNDGYTDLIGVEQKTEQQFVWRVFWNDGKGVFKPDTTQYSFNTLLLNMSLADVNNDGFGDLIVANTFTPGRLYNDGFIVFYNDGSGCFNQSKQFSDAFYVDLRQIYIDDFNNDGYLDAAFFGPQLGGRIFINDKAGNFSTSNEKKFGGVESSGQFTAGDFTGDNQIDIVVSNIHSLDMVSGCFSIEKNCGNASYSCPESCNNFYYSMQMFVGSLTPITADFDNDGALDIMQVGLQNSFLTKNKSNVNAVTNKENIFNFGLSQNYPNPFNPLTVISYQIPKSCKVSLKIYDILGKEIRTLVNENKEAGEYKEIFDASNLPSGVYIYKLAAGVFVKSDKMIFTK